MRIVYHSSGGRYSDNPRAIHEALRDRTDLAHTWLCNPAHLDGFPSGVATVDIDEPEAIQALESADLVIANTYTEHVWEKRPGATYLQTWHGTPLKRIHHDMRWSPPGRLAALAPDVARWDYLLSPNSTSTETLRQAFGFTGRMLETGYPRNDVLAAPERVRDRVRRQLGIPDGTTAVLYTPTWRDDAFYAPGRDLPLDLDVDDFVKHLGDDHVLLLRLHALMTGRMAEVDHPAVLDVSSHPDVSELYLAADAMVTDYSSTMFDFAVTGKPMLFYTYDLCHYRDELRGFYFDFEATAPGPLLGTMEELLDGLRELPAVSREYEERYARFRARFCHLDDGRATERVIARLLPGDPLR